MGINMIRASLTMLLTLTVLTGCLYPLAVTVIAKVLFPAQAAGSLIVEGGKVKGSTLIGQSFDEPRYFWSRLSATGPFPYNAASSSGSNYGPHNPDLKKAMAARRAALEAADPGHQAVPPIDLLMASASGLDPHISPEAAAYQASRVARVRNLPLAKVNQLIAEHTTGRQLGFLGEPTVNVVTLNHALDR